MLVNVLNPQLLIFSGEGMRYGDLLLVPLRSALFARILPGLEDGLELHVEPLGAHRWFAPMRPARIWARFRQSKNSRIEPLNRSSRRKEALTQDRMSLPPSAATRFRRRMRRDAVYLLLAHESCCELVFAAHIREPLLPALE